MKNIKSNSSLIVILITLIIIAIFLLSLVIINHFQEETMKNSETVNEQTASLSDEELNNILKKEQNDIVSTINKRFSAFVSSFHISQIKLYQQGEYCGVILEYINQASTGSDLYRTILQKKENAWQVLTTPELILSYEDFPSIPKGIIRDLNSIF